MRRPWRHDRGDPGFASFVGTMVQSLSQHGFDDGLGLAMPGHGAFTLAARPMRGGARARKAGWKMSVMIMRPPQQGHAGLRSAGLSDGAGSSVIGTARSSR